MKLNIFQIIIKNGICDFVSRSSERKVIIARYKFTVCRRKVRIIGYELRIVRENSLTFLIFLFC